MISFPIGISFFFHFRCRLVSGCKKCPIFSVCPLKSVIGDHVEPTAPGKAATTGKKN